MPYGDWCDTEPPLPWGRCTSDACACGRRPCPTPDACLMPEDDGSVEMLGRLLVWSVVAAAVVGAIFGPWA